MKEASREILNVTYYVYEYNNNNNRIIPYIRRTVTFIPVTIRLRKLLFGKAIFS